MSNNIEKKANVRANTLFNTVKSMFGVIYPLLAFPYVSRVLMAENVGKVNFGNSVVSYFSLIASLGVTTYAVRECSQVRENPARLNETASQIFSLNILSTAVAYIALAVTLFSARALENYKTLICIQSTTLLFTTLGADWINTAMEDFRYIAIRTMGMQALSLVLMFILVKKTEDYLLYALISVVASSGANMVNIFYRRKFCDMRFTWHMNIKRHFPPVLLLFSTTFSQIIYTNSDTTMLGLMKGDYEVGLYSTAVKIYRLVNSVIASIAWVVMPQLSEGFAKKDYAEINRLLKYSMNFIVVLGLPCIVGINVIAEPVVYVMAGPEYMGAVPALRILTCTLLFSLIGGWMGNMIMIPAGREKICLLSSAFSALVNIILNFIFIPHFGLYAAAATTAAAEMVGVLVLSRYLDENIRVDGMRQMVKAPLAGSIAIIVVSQIVKGLFASYVAIAVSTILLGAVAYGICLLFLKNEFAWSFLLPVLKKIKKG